ncbi:MAG: DUF1282 family protein [Gammaproteobacteria bacterium]|nr:DUF1282 family protein [Gammaproteobacteria bacterium]
MVLTHVFGLFTNPKREFETIRDEECTVKDCYMSHVFILAAIPAIAGFIGATQIGWKPGLSSMTAAKLTMGSAFLMCLAAYFAALVGIYIIGRSVYWMAETYGIENPNQSRCIALVAYVATPMLLAGVLGFFPSLWLYMLGLLAAIAYSTYLLYTGLPVVLNLPGDRGFLFSSAVLTVVLVVFVGILIATAILWGFGLGPVFVR